jgi:hypothetical protein
MVAGVLDRTVVAGMDDHDLFISADTVGPHPHRLTQQRFAVQLVWDGVLAGL